MKLYKVLDSNNQPVYGNGLWHLPKNGKPGKWMPKITDVLVPCERGYHYARKDHLIFWLNANIYEAENKGALIDAGDKMVGQQGRLLRHLDTWNERTARLFAADCAEHVLHIFERLYPTDYRPRQAIETARLFADGRTSMSELVAARVAAWVAAGDAARVAAGDAARVAAGDAARVAAWVATGVAAWVAARGAARVAAWGAAGVAAGDAERRWQTERLMQYLNGSTE